MTVMLKYRNKLNIILNHKFCTLYKIVLISHCGACLFKNFVAIVLMNKNNERALELCCCDKKKTIKNTHITTYIVTFASKEQNYQFLRIRFLAIHSDVGKKALFGNFEWFTHWTI